MSLSVRPIKRTSFSEIEAELEALGVDSRGIKIMAPKARHFLLEATGLTTKSAIILKQEALSAGAEVALPRDVISFTHDHHRAIIMGTEKQLLQLVKKLQRQPFTLPQLAQLVKEALENQRKGQPAYLNLGDYSLPLGKRTLIMGILNVTPDSFSDGGHHQTLERAVAHARQMVEEGADIIDVGGESTRPGATPIPEEEETERLIPVLTALLKEIDAPVSVDTYKAPVAEKALREGAHMINDVWGGKADKDMFSVAARFEVPICLMHNRSEAVYRDLMGEITADLRESVQMALDADVRPEQIILDPGIGFGKTVEHNLVVMKHLREINSLGYPVLLGTSRKSLIGKVLDVPMDERVEGTAATVAYGIAEGVDIVRVHDVKEMIRAARMTDAIVRR